MPAKMIWGSKAFQRQLEELFGCSVSELVGFHCFSLLKAVEGGIMKTTDFTRPGTVDVLLLNPTCTMAEPQQLERKVKQLDRGWLR